MGSNEAGGAKSAFAAECSVSVCLKNGHQVSWRTVLLKRVHIPITKRMLKTAEPTMVPIPTSVMRKCIIKKFSDEVVEN